MFDVNGVQQTAKPTVEGPLDVILLRLRQVVSPRAEVCRIKAKSFRGQKARTQMLHLAADYYRKAIQAEAFKVQKQARRQYRTSVSAVGTSASSQ
jgi:hypothetical protein